MADAVGSVRIRDEWIGRPPAGPPRVETNTRIRRSGVMRLFITSLVLVSGVPMLPAPAAAADPDAPGMMAAGRELNRQISALQEYYGSSNSLMQIGGLFQDTMTFQTALIDLAQKVRSGATREQLVLGFDTVNKQLKGILAEVDGVATTDVGVKMICRRLSAADAALHF